ncbi:acyl carrier protein [Ancylomarina sp. YFZ004]
MNNDGMVKEKLHHYVSEATFSNKNDIKSETLLFEEGLFDSMGLLFLVDFIRDEFLIETKDDELVVENFASINSISVFILDRLEVKESCELVKSQK